MIVEQVAAVRFTAEVGAVRQLVGGVADRDFLLVGVGHRAVVMAGHRLDQRLRQLPALEGQSAERGVVSAVNGFTT